MIPLTMLLQATEIQPLPGEDAAMASQLPADAGVVEAATAVGGDIDMLQLILHASIPVQLVMLLLLAASIASWVMQHLMQEQCSLEHQLYCHKL